MQRLRMRVIFVVAAVVTVEFGRPEATFNESEGKYTMCIVKDKETVRSVIVSLTDIPGTAERNIGTYTHKLFLHPPFLSMYVFTYVCIQIHMLYLIIWFHTDYQSVPQRLITIQPTSDRTCFSGVIIDDKLGLEGEETFTLSLEKPPVDGVVVGQDKTNINILDDDGTYWYTYICMSDNRV